MTNKVIEDFNSFDTKGTGKVKQLMLMLPDGYDMDYLIYGASSNLREEEHIENLPLHKVVKRMMFKKFDSFIEETISERS